MTGNDDKNKQEGRNLGLWSGALYCTLTRSSRRAINLVHIGSTPYYVSNTYATTMNIIELQEAERAEGFCLIRLWWVLAHNNRRIKQNKTTVVVCSASCKPHKQKKRRLTVVFNLSGSKGIRTPDPLLVRQML